MSTFNNVDEAREFFKGDTFATNNGMVIDELGKNYAKCSVLLNENHKNAYGKVMGGVIFTLGDFAFAGCVQLKNVTIHSSATELGAYINTNPITIVAPKGSNAETYAKNNNIGFSELK